LRAVGVFRVFRSRASVGARGACSFVDQAPAEHDVLSRTSAHPPRRGRHEQCKRIDTRASARLTVIVFTRAASPVTRSHHAISPVTRSRRTTPVRLDIVIPAHNEEHRIDRTLRAYRAHCTDPDTTFLVALDRCTDDTSAVVALHARDDARVQLLSFPKLGKGGVLAETFRRSSADIVGFVDADCATPPAELLRLVDVAHQSDLAIASRRHPASVLPSRRPLARRAMSAGFAFGVRRLFRLPFADTQCGAKALRREVVDRCMPFVSSRDFLFDVDLLLVARRLGFRIAEVPTVWVDQAGSRVHRRHDSLRMAGSAMRLWLHHRILPVDGTAAEVPLESSLSGVARGRSVIDLQEARRASA
jgi:Glycosyl transferase family 2